MKRCYFAACIVLAGVTLHSQPCEAPAEVDGAIRSGLQGRELRDRFPTDYFAHRGYQDRFMRGGVFSKNVQDEYRALWEQHPNEPLYLLLYARTLKGTDTKQALALLEQVLAREAGNPQAHLKMLEIYAAPNFSDHAKLREHAESYWKSCPESLGGYPYVHALHDPAFNAAAAARLRPLIEKRDDDEALRLYSTLWSMEFRAVGLAEQDPVRERIRQDAARLRAMDLTKRQWLVSTLRQAYKSVSDQEGIKWAEERLPDSSTVPAMIAKWRIDNRKPGEDYESFSERFAKQAEEWIRQFPDNAEIRGERFHAIERLDSVPQEEVVRAAEEWIRVYEQHRSYTGAPYIDVASFYARQRIRFDQIPRLLEKGLKQLPVAGPVSDLYPASSPVSSRSVYDRDSAARIYLQLKNYDRAGELLAQIVPELEKARPAESASEGEKRSFAARESSVYSNMERLAWIQGRKEDALQYGRRHVLAGIVFSPMSAGMYRSMLLRRWKEVKGSEAGFDKWYGAPKPAAGTTARAATAETPGKWTTLSKPLPEFKIQDAEGKTWQLADLKGKVTLVNLWATWCGPCRAELPLLEKLSQRVRDRSDLAVVTLNVDDNLGLVMPFLKENHYTFPVLAAADYVNGLIKELSIPRNWIVDAQGMLRQERIGFGSDGDSWIDETLGIMEKAKSPVR